MSPERGRRNPDWGSIFRRVKFRLCPNGTNFMSFQHYSAPRVWWRAQFLHLSFRFSSHFWKWTMPVSDFCMWAVVLTFLDATRLMVFSDSATEQLSLQQMVAWSIWCDFHVLLHLFLVEMHYVLQIPVDTWVVGSFLVLLLMYFQLWICVIYEIPFMPHWWDTHFHMCIVEIPCFPGLAGYSYLLHVSYGHTDRSLSLCMRVPQ